jgi:tetratricopeptide (TPR) repeat protein
MKVRKLNSICFASVLLALSVYSGAAQGPVRTINVITEPEASVWIGTVFYGTADEKGRLMIRTAAPGQRTIRVRSAGFSEGTKTLLPTQKEITIRLEKTTDPAELAFQEGERQSQLDRQKAVAAYRNAITLDPKLVRGHLALARNLAESGGQEEALKVIANVRKLSPRNAEASAIEGRIFKDISEEAKAIVSFKRAITEGRGFQPEAYTGLGLLYKTRAESLGDDEAAATTAYNEAAKHLAIAVKQLSGAPDATVIMQLLGMIYEQQKRYKEAIAVYEEFLRLFPDSVEAEAVRSFIVQIKKEMVGEQ